MICYVKRIHSINMKRKQSQNKMPKCYRPFWKEILILLLAQKKPFLRFFQRQFAVIVFNEEIDDTREHPFDYRVPDIIVARRIRYINNVFYHFYNHFFLLFYIQFFVCGYLEHNFREYFGDIVEGKIWEILGDCLNKRFLF